MWQGHEVTNDSLVSQSVLLINPQHPSPYVAPASFLEPRLQEQCLVPESLLNDCPRECLSQQEETLGLWRSRYRTAPDLEVSSAAACPGCRMRVFTTPPLSVLLFAQTRLRMARYTRGRRWPSLASQRALPTQGLCKGTWGSLGAAAGGGSLCLSWPSPYTTFQVRTGPGAVCHLP